MDAGELLTQLCQVIDEHRWDDLAELLSPEFVWRAVHTGEELDRDGWVQFNREYPGFEHLVVEDLVASGDRAVARCHVTGRDDGELLHFQVATFVRSDGDRIVEMTEVWTDVDQTPPPGTRPD